MDICQVLVPREPLEHIHDTSTEDGLAAVIELGIDSADALALEQILARTPAGMRVLTALDDHRFYVRAVKSILPFDERHALFIVDAMHGLQVRGPDDASFLGATVEFMLCCPEYQHVNAEEARSFVATLKALSPSQCLVVARAAQRAMRLLYTRRVPLSEAMRTAGLMK